MAWHQAITQTDANLWFLRIWQNKNQVIYIHKIDITNTVKIGNLIINPGHQGVNAHTRQLVSLSMKKHTSTHANFNLSSATRFTKSLWAHNSNLAKMFCSEIMMQSGHNFAHGTAAELTGGLITPLESKSEQNEFSHFELINDFLPMNVPDFNQHIKHPESGTHVQWQWDYMCMW